MRWSVIILFLCAFLSVYADDLTLADGKIFKGVTVTKIEPDGLTIIHSDGAAKLFFKDLPPSIQEKYHYDPQKAEDYTKGQTQLLERAKEVEEQRKLQTQKEDEKLAAKKAIEAQANSRTQEYLSQISADQRKLEDLRSKGFEVEFRVSQISTTGALGYITVYEKYSYATQEPDPTGLHPDRKKTVIKEDVRTTRLDSPVWITDIPNARSLADDDHWHGYIWPTGMKEYTTVLGSSKRVRAFTASEARALQLLGLN